MSSENIDPFFEPIGTMLGFSRSFIDPRFLLLSDEDFWNRYHFDMSSYGFHERRPYWREGKNIPVCSHCSEEIIDSSQLKRKFGVNFCPTCFREEMIREWKKFDKRKRIDLQFMYFLRVANILDQVPEKKLQIFMEQCRKQVSGII